MKKYNRFYKSIIGNTLITSFLFLGVIQAQENPKPETVAVFTRERPGNPTITPDGKLIVTMSALVNPKINVNEVLGNDKLKPFPDENWASKPKSDGRGIEKTIGIRTSSKGIVWILDMGSEENPPKLTAFQANSGRLEKVIVLPKYVLRNESFTQDFAIDEKNEKIYIADMSFNALTGRSEFPAIIVVDTKTGASRRILERHQTLMPEYKPIIVDGKPVAHKLPSGEIVPHYYGINPIAIDPQGEFVYYGAMSGTKIYRIPANDLANDNLNHNALSAKIEVYGNKPFCDGFIVDAKGNVYITDVGNNAVGVANRSGYRILFQDKQKFAWADGFDLSRDGWVYVTVNQLHRLPGLNHGEDSSKPPFYVHRFRVLN